MTRKIRSDSVLDAMPLHQQDALIGWLMEERLAPDMAVKRLWEDFCVKTSETALGTFWQRYVAPRLLRRSAQSAMSFPQESGGALGAINWDDPNKALVRQQFFECLTSPNRDPKELALFGEMVAAASRADLERDKLKTRRQETAVRTRLKRADQRLSERRVNLLEKKAAEATAAANDSTLTDAQKAQRIREIFKRE